MDQMQSEVWSKGMRGWNERRRWKREDVSLDVESKASVSRESEEINASCAATKELDKAAQAVCKMLRVLPGHQGKQALCQPEMNDSPREAYWCLYQ